ncbi:SGNH/GDSL hydrolase family protein [Sandarakinorhabdus rubra]|uniref:SGNH/GDSL hydrolase family protein n=1 Tax=Sandarakinorhabdus rubra TaxID=2672568 RepID=UPI0013DA7B40|nr:GDSL-type esterase/lipase family protein [Sandarakinorhabdus rubra]
MAKHPAFLLIDRTAALFCGVVAGIAIGLAFAPQINALLAPESMPESAGPSPPTASASMAVARTALKAPPPGLSRAVAENRPFRIGVFGDSFGDGLWAALYNQLPRREAFQVLRYSQQATGFTRYRQTNLQQRLEEQLAEGPVDVAVISFGANDTQGLWVEGRAAPFLSPAWQAEIGSRVTRYVEALRAQGATVVWIGLPVMRNPAYDADIARLNRFFAGLMARLDVPFVETRALAADARGQFTTHLEGPDGTRFLARAGDGIHMSGKGYQRLTAGLATQLRRWGQAARKGEAVPDSLVPPPAPMPPPLAKPKLVKPELVLPDIVDPAPSAAEAAEPAAAATPTVPPAATPPAAAAPAAPSQG